MNSFLIPQQIFVGDEASFFYHLPLNYNIEKLNIFDVNNMPENEKITIKNISVEKRNNGYFLRIDFIAWQTGNINFPELIMSNLNIDLPEIFVYSVLETYNIKTLQPPRAPILIPGTIYLLYGCSALFLSIMILLLFFIVGLKKSWFLFLKKIFIKNNNKAFRNKLNKLNKRFKKIYKMFTANKLSYEKYENIWFKDFEKALKNYLSFFCIHKNKNWHSLTYSEMLDILKQSTPNQKLIHEHFELLFNTVQIVRFSGIDFFSKEVFDYQRILLTKSFDLIELCTITSSKKYLRD